MAADVEVSLLLASERRVRQIFSRRAAAHGHIGGMKGMALERVVSSGDFLFEVARQFHGENGLADLCTALAEISHVARIETLEDFANLGIQPGFAQEVTIRLSGDGKTIRHLHPLGRQLTIHLAQRRVLATDQWHVVNLPAPYVTGHLPDIGYVDPGSPMDFHPYCEIYLGQEWLTFDPRFNVPRIGRVKVAHGADAVDGAFATIFGEANRAHFEVWAYQVNPLQVSVGDPIDLAKRLDGTETARLNQVL